MSCAGNHQFGQIDFASEDTLPKYLPDTTFDTDQIKLEITVDPKRKMLSGWCHSIVNILSINVQEIIFDAVDMEIYEVTAHKAHSQKAVNCKWQKDGKRLTVILPSPAQYASRWVISIHYGLKNPKAGIHFFGPSKEYPDWPIIAWTQGQSDDARCWFPCRDVPSEKALSEVIVTVPQEFCALSNGTLIKKETNSKTRTTTFTWKMSKPHSMYLFSLIVGKFEMYQENYYKIPLIYYFPRGKKEDMLRGTSKTKKAMEFLIQETGVNYPFDSYTQVAVFQFSGGMENTTICSLSDKVLLDERAAIDIDCDALIVHELAHQWFGNLVTCKDWTHGWLNESFASYYETLFFEKDQDLDHFRYRCWQMAQGYFNEAEERYQRPIVTRVWRESFQLFDRHLYVKGGCILHFFRSLLGHEAWRRAIWYYLEKHRFSSVETRDLIEAIYESTGINLESQFEQWIFRAGHPEFKISYNWNSNKKVALLWIVQKQAIKDQKMIFNLPVQIAFIGPREIRRFKVQLTKVEHYFQFQLPWEPENVVFDPDSDILLKKVEFIKPDAMWVKQLTDENVLIRLEAIEKLASTKTHQAMKLLHERFNIEPFWWLKGKIAEKLGEMGFPESKTFLKTALREKHPKIRRQIVAALGKYNDPALAPEFKSIFENDPSLSVACTALQSLTATQHKFAKEAIKKALKTDSWTNMLKCTAIQCLSKISDNPQEILKFLKPGTPCQVKAEAIRELGRLFPGDYQILNELEKHLDDPSPEVVHAAIKAIEKSANQELVDRLKKRLENTRDSFLRGVLDTAIRNLRMGKFDSHPTPELIK